VVPYFADLSLLTQARCSSLPISADFTAAVADRPCRLHVMGENGLDTLSQNVGV
jgi:hypothetical protein